MSLSEGIVLRYWFQIWGRYLETRTERQPVSFSQFLKNVILASCQTELQLRRFLGLEAMIADIPHLSKEYSPKNDLPVNVVSVGTNKKLWWICPKCNFEYEASGNNRVHGYGRCPACAGRVLTEKNNLAATFPHLIIEYSERNELPASAVFARTSQKLLWVCQRCGHKWWATGYNRANAKGAGCPKCRRRKSANKQRQSSGGS